MIDSATIWLWTTDLALLGMAYFIGRVHASIKLRDVYTKNLERLLDEVRLMRKKVDRMAELYAIAQEAIKKQ